MKEKVGEGGININVRPMLAFRKNFLQRCDILLHGDRGREVYTEYPCCCCCCCYYYFYRIGYLGN